MTVLKCPRVVGKIPYLRVYYVAVIHIDCYKLCVQSCIHISLLIINANILFSTWVFSRLYESINLYVEWPVLADSAMGMLQQFIRWYQPVSFFIWQASVGKQNGALLPDMVFLRVQYLDLYFFFIYILTIFLKLYHTNLILFCLLMTLVLSLQILISWHL